MLFPLHERSPVLQYMYIACFSYVYIQHIRFGVSTISTATTAAVAAAAAAVVVVVVYIYVPEQRTFVKHLHFML